MRARGEKQLYKRRAYAAYVHREKGLSTELKRPSETARRQMDHRPYEVPARGGRDQ